MTNDADWKEVNPAKVASSDDDEAQVENEIPKDLKDSYQALKLLTQTHDLLLDGKYSFRDLKRVQQSVVFIENIHKQALENILKHPHCELIQELKEIKKQVSNDNKN